MFAKKNLLISISIILSVVILGGFYSYIQHEKLVSAEYQLRMRINQEDRERKEKEQSLLAQEQREAKIRVLCSAELERNGNYLVSNETLNTNYDRCLHSFGL